MDPDYARDDDDAHDKWHSLHLRSVDLRDDDSMEEDGGERRSRRKLLITITISR